MGCGLGKEVSFSLPLLFLSFFSLRPPFRSLRKQPFLLLAPRRLPDVSPGETS